MEGRKASKHEIRKLILTSAKRLFLEKGGDVFFFLSHDRSPR